MPTTYRLERQQLIQRSLDETFDFFADAANLEAITPDFLHFQITTPQPIEVREGTLIDYRLRLFGVPIKWRTRIDEFVPQQRFVDSQLQGPYRLWRHLHEFQQTEQGVLMLDRVDYQLPLGIAGRAAHVLWVKATLNKIFDHRQRRIEHLLGPVGQATASG